MISGIDYIMQLEQEVEKQRRYVKEEKEKKKELQQRIDKAIEYINNASYFDGSSMCANDLLEILGDKENE